LHWKKPLRLQRARGVNLRMLAAELKPVPHWPKRKNIKEEY
jgi:hypothetical protein